MESNVAIVAAEVDSVNNAFMLRLLDRVKHASLCLPFMFCFDNI